MLLSLLVTNYSSRLQIIRKNQLLKQNNQLSMLRQKMKYFTRYFDTAFLYHSCFLDSLQTVLTCFFSYPKTYFSCAYGPSAFPCTSNHRQLTRQVLNLQDIIQIVFLLVRHYCCMLALCSIIKMASWCVLFFSFTFILLWTFNRSIICYNS